MPGHLNLVITTMFSKNGISKVNSLEKYCLHARETSEMSFKHGKVVLLVIGLFVSARVCILKGLDVDELGLP